MIYNFNRHVSVYAKPLQRFCVWHGFGMGDDIINTIPMIRFKADLDSLDYPQLKIKEIEYNQHFMDKKCPDCEDKKIWVIFNFRRVAIDACCPLFESEIKKDLRSLGASGV